MKKASGFTYLAKKPQPKPQQEQEQAQQGQSPKPLNNLFGMQPPQPELDLNVFVVTFDGMKESQKNLYGGDPYNCKKCKAILNKFSSLKSYEEVVKQNLQSKAEMKESQSVWKCEFCGYPNILMIEKEEIPSKQDVVYMIESAHENIETENDATLVFCIDVSGSMNTTSEVKGKMNLKFGLSKEEIEMLKQFMEPGDEAQFNFLPGNHNKDKTFISRKQCILSAIENQLQEIKKADPHKKIGFVLFNNEVIVLGDEKVETINILGDKLNNKNTIMDSLNNFKLNDPIGQSYESLLNNLNKTEAKGQTALGPAIISAIEVAARGSPGSSVFLCTDGMANIGIGSLDVIDEGKKQFYEQLAAYAKSKNVTVNIMTIKGEASKLDIIGKLVEETNGNIKVVNPEKLADDFANILKDEVVGLNVEAKIMLHKAMMFRNEDQKLLKDNKATLTKDFANATVNTKISFEYQVRNEEDLKFMEIKLEELKKVPFQAQICYSSPKGGRFMRVISSQNKTTTEKKVAEKEANIGVVHQRVATNTAAMYSRGMAPQSQSYNNQWSDYLNNNFKSEKHVQQQQKFNMNSMKLNKAINRKVQKEEMYSQKMEQPMDQIKEAPQENNQKSGGGFFAKISSVFGGDKKPVQKKQVQKKKMSGLLNQYQKMQKPIASKAPMKGKGGSKKQESFSDCDSDEQEMQIKKNMMEKQMDYELD